MSVENHPTHPAGTLMWW